MTHNKIRQSVHRAGGQNAAGTCKWKSRTHMYQAEPLLAPNLRS